MFLIVMLEYKAEPLYQENVTFNLSLSVSEKFAEQFNVEFVYAVEGAIAISVTDGNEFEVNVNCAE